MQTPPVPEQSDNPPALWLRKARSAQLAGALLWVAPMLVIGVLVALRPTHRTVTLDSYHVAAANWWVGQSLYAGPQGMNYLPHFALLFTPFHLLPLWLGEVLWRFCAAGALGGGLWWLMRALFRSAPERPFFWATLVAMPLCMTSLRNGNANAHFGGVALLAMAALLDERWWLTLALMALVTAIKPLGVVLLLLAPIVYAPLRWRLPVVLLGLAVFPFLFASPAYVCSQYRAAWSNLQACAVVTEHRFADINGIFRTFGTALGPTASKLVRVLAGGLTAVAWWCGARRLREPLPVLWLYALATGYLMLFNPMNEENSYSILAPALGAWAAFFLFRPEAQYSLSVGVRPSSGAATIGCSSPVRIDSAVAAPEDGRTPLSTYEARACRNRGWTIVIMALSMGLLPNIVRPLVGNHFALIWHPSMTIVFLALLGWFVWRWPVLEQAYSQL